MIFMLLGRSQAAKTSLTAKRKLSENILLCTREQFCSFTKN